MSAPSVLPIMLALVRLVAAAPAAADGVSASMSVGTGPASLSSSDRYSAADATLTGTRMALGYRRGRLALEAGLSPESLSSCDGGNGCANEPEQMLTVDLSGIYARPVRPGIELTTRVRMSRMNQIGWYDDDLGGRGLGVGVGLQRTGKASIFRGALFVDLGFDFYRLHHSGDGNGPSIDASVLRISIGARVGG